MVDLIELLQTNDVERLRQGVIELLNLIEQLRASNEQLRAEVQQLKDELNRLKGEQGQPKFKAKPPGASPAKYSSERERRQPRPRHKRAKKGQLKIDRDQIVPLDRASLPADAEWKGYRAVVVQDLWVKSDNIRFRREKYYAESTGHSYVAPLPAGYEGQFGPGLKALVLMLFYQGQMTEPKIKQVLEQFGCQISTGEISNLLIKEQAGFHQEKAAVYEAGLRSSPWQHMDDTGLQIDGQSYHTHIVCNPLYTSYLTTAQKDRLSVLDVLTHQQPRRFRINEQTLQVLSELGLSALKRRQVARLPRDQDFSQAEFQALLADYQLKLGPTQQQWLLSAAATAAYHAQADWPIVQLLICDEAPQFKGITAEVAACWVHDGRHYKKLHPWHPLFQQELDQFLDDYWQFYHHLVAFRDCPSRVQADYLRQEFDQLVAQKYRYQALNKRIAQTKAKRTELLAILAHPEIVPHNNPAELAARQRVRKRKISFGPRSQDGLRAWDTFLSLVDTTRKLGLCFFDYLSDRLQALGRIPPLADLIATKAAQLQLDASWRFGIPDFPPSY